ncbi:MAG: hypothetical protein CMO13_04030 [Thaumarchaeota archaeon]|nr:hypothetical protein [Nitrososphaerota archaeon]
MSEHIVKSKYFFYLLQFQVFISGASIMALELLGSRLLAPYYGSTLFVWGSLIGITLTGLSAGYSWGGKKSDTKASYQTFSLLIFIAGSYALLTTLLSADILKMILVLKIGDMYGPLLSSAVFLLIPTFLLGAVTPFAIKLSAKSLQTIGQTTGNLYSLSTLGSIFGTFATTFMLVPILGVNVILYSISSILIISSVIGITKQIKFIAIILIAISIHSAVVVQPPVAGVIFEKDTLYHKILVHDDSVNNIRTLILDNNFHSAMDLNNPERIVYEYTKFFHLGLLFVDEPNNVLFIGGGGFSAPKKFFVDYPEMIVNVVEIDQEVVNVGSEFFAVPEDERLKISTNDGRIFLRNTNEKYNIIILDAYDKSYVPFHLMTREFNELVYEHLTEDGVFISNIITSIEGNSADLFLAEIKTMKSVFPNVYIYPVVSDQQTVIQNVIVVAHKQEDSVTKFELLARQDNASVELVQAIENEYKKNINLESYKILDDNFAPVENYLNPLTGKQFIKRIISEDGELILSENNSYDLYHPTNQNKIFVVFLTIILLLYSIYSYRDLNRN